MEPSPVSGVHLCMHPSASQQKGRRQTVGTEVQAPTSTQLAQSHSVDTRPVEQRMGVHVRPHECVLFVCCV